MKILVAEDDQLTRRGLVEVLEAEGYETVEAADGAEALTLFDATEPDVVCLDIMMPVIDGYEVCRRLRARPSDVPVLFISAKSEEIDKVVGLELGADDFLTKPFGIKEVVARIRAVTRRVVAARTHGRSRRGAPRASGWPISRSLPDELRARRGDEVDRSEPARDQDPPSAPRPRRQGARSQHHLQRLLGAGLSALEPDPRPDHLPAPQADRARSELAADHHHGARGGLSLPAGPASVEIAERLELLLGGGVEFGAR